MLVLHIDKNGLCAMPQVSHDTGHLTVTRWLLQIVLKLRPPI